MSRAQFDLWRDSEPSGEAYDVLRPIHYLGSKLRVLPSILTTIDDLAPRGGHVVDLFAGTGTVSRALAQHRQVTAVDVQEYSRVLCSSLLGNWRPGATEIAHFEQAIFEAETRDSPFAALIEYEHWAIDQYRHANPEPLSDLVEHGSLEAFRTRRGFDGHVQLQHALAESNNTLIERGRSASASTLTARHFGGVYFSYLQATLLDAALEFASCFTDKGRDYFMAVALSAASDLANTVGKQFAQPIRTRAKDGSFKLHNLRRVVTERARSGADLLRRWESRYSNLQQTGVVGTAVRADFSEFLQAHECPVDAIYADPPYTRDHYSRYYHVLETMSIRDNPRLSDMVSGGIRKLSRGLYRSDRHQSPFSIISQAPGAFDALFSQVRGLGVPLVLSYSPFGGNRASRPRVVSVQAIVDSAKQHFRHVDVQQATNIAHNKLNAARLNFAVTYQAEILIVCRP